MNWLYILCILLAAVSAVLTAKIILMRKAAAEICKEFAEKLKDDTNTLICISSRDSVMCRLADGINSQLRELRRSRRYFSQGNAALKNAVTNISHDLRTPLTAICGYIELMDKAEKSETMTRYINIIRDRTEIMTRLTEELFRYSIIASAENCGMAEPVIINDVLEESAAAFYAVLKERGIEPEIGIPEAKVTRLLNLRGIVAYIFKFI